MAIIVFRRYGGRSKCTARKSWTFPHDTNVTVRKGAVDGDAVAVMLLHKLQSLFIKVALPSVPRYTLATALIANSVDSWRLGHGRMSIYFSPPTLNGIVIR